MISFSSEKKNREILKGLKNRNEIARWKSYKSEFFNENSESNYWPLRYIDCRFVLSTYVLFHQY